VTRRAVGDGLLKALINERSRADRGLDASLKDN
jgi:hypothetical protein